MGARRRLSLFASESQDLFAQANNIDLASEQLKHSPEVAALRNEFGADLVHLIGAFELGGDGIA